jgi:hypothetical protein
MPGGGDKGRLHTFAKIREGKEMSEEPKRLRAEWVEAKLNSIEAMASRILKILEPKKAEIAKLTSEKPKLRAEYTEDPVTGAITAFIVEPKTEKEMESEAMGIRDLIAGEKEE